MGTIIFIFCLIIIILSYKMLDDNLFEKLVNFLFGFVFISMGGNSCRISPVFTVLYFNFNFWIVTV